MHRESSTIFYLLFNGQEKLYLFLYVYGEIIDNLVILVRNSIHKYMDKKNITKYMPTIKEPKIVITYMDI